MSPHQIRIPCINILRTTKRIMAAKSSRWLSSIPELSPKMLKSMQDFGEKTMGATQVQIKATLHLNLCNSKYPKKLQNHHSINRSRIWLKDDKPSAEASAAILDESIDQQLTRVPRDMEMIAIDGNTPTKDEWKALGCHFGNITDLEIDAGFHEDLDDRDIPNHWPLERLLISSACGELLSNPLLFEGKINHLILLLTHELRFEGPDNAELVSQYKAAIEKGEKEVIYLGDSKLQLTSIPQLAKDWWESQYNSDGVWEEKPEPKTESNLRKIEVIENNAMETFSRMMLARPHLLNNLQSLVLRSTGTNDLTLLHPTLFRAILKNAINLRELSITTGGLWQGYDMLPRFYEDIPPNLISFNFRGPVRLAFGEDWVNWVGHFANPQFLPQLETVSFVLDIDYAQRDGQIETVDATDEELKKAYIACRGLYEVLRGRGIKVEKFTEPWFQYHRLFNDVDERWYNV